MRRLAARALVGAAALLVVAALGPMLLGLAQRWPERPAGVPDGLLVTEYPTNAEPSTWNGVSVLRPSDGGLKPILDGARDPTLSPDGRELFFRRYYAANDEPRVAVVALASDTLATRWSVDVATGDDGRLVGLSLAATADRVYVARLRREGDVSILALDRVDGLERRRWSVELADAAPLLLRASPDGHTLVLVLSRATDRVLMRFRLPDGQEMARYVVRGNAPWVAGTTADGRSLYGIVSQEFPREVDFLDLETASVERVSLPVAVDAPRQWLPYESGVSPDGRQLYVLLPSRRELAIIDMAERRLEQVAHIELPEPGASGAWDTLVGLLGGLDVGHALAKNMLVGSLQLSRDGQRLYAVGASLRSGGVRVQGVWVIDTRTWRVAQRWLEDVEPVQVLLSADGRSLVVQEDPWGGVNWKSGAVHVLDATTGAEVTRSDPLPPSNLTSLVELYRQTYGRSPTPSAGQAPPVAAAPVAAMLIDLQPSAIVAGDSVTARLRFVDPRDGQPARAETTSSGLRYTPPARVELNLTSGEHTLNATLEPASDGRWETQLSVPNPDRWSFGAWSAEVVATWPDGTVRRVRRDDVLVVRPAFAASDGRRYVLEISTEPHRPLADRDAAVRVAFVDAERHTPLPADIDLEDGLPDRLELSAQSTSVTVVRLAAAGHGVYAGSVHLWSAGTWRVWVGLPNRSGVTRTYLIGILDAVD